VIAPRNNAWVAARLGKATASRIADVVARTRSGYAASRANYAAELVCERLTGRPAESFSSPAMQWGLEKEADARQLYAFACDVEVEPAGFLDHPSIAFAGASPDGLVGEVGLVEIKCPLTATHIETLIGQGPAGRYLTQMQWQLAVTGRLWCDFVSYDPRLPVGLQLFVQRIERDKSRIAELESEVRVFLAEVAARLDDLEARSIAAQISAGPGRLGEAALGLVLAQTTGVA
jgi:putative phage-type endonuclease